MGVSFPGELANQKGPAFSIAIWPKPQTFRFQLPEQVPTPKAKISGTAKRKPLIFLFVEEMDTLDYGSLGGRFRNDLVRNLVSFFPTKPDKIGLGKSGLVIFAVFQRPKSAISQKHLHA